MVVPPLKPEPLHLDDVTELIPSSNASNFESRTPNETVPSLESKFSDKIFAEVKK